MAFSKSNVNFQFQQPNVPGLVRQAPDIAGGLESLFNQYMQMQQNKRADASADLQGQAARQQLAAGQRAAGAADLQETAQFGAPLSTYSQQEKTAASQQASPDFVGPKNPRLEKLIAGLNSISEKSKMSAKAAQADFDKTISETEENKAQAKKLGAEAEMSGAAKGTKAEDDLRGELQTLSKPFVQVRDSMGRIEAAAKNPSAAGDLALIFNYMKVLDPGSTVREGEFATAQNSAGMPERIRAKYNQVVNGERLEEGQRADFVDRARDLYKSQESIQKQTESNYRSLAERRGARPENVILDQGLAKQSGGDQIQTRTLKDGSKVRVKSNGKGGWVEVP